MFYIQSFQSSEGQRWNGEPSGCALAPKDGVACIIFYHSLVGCCITFKPFHKATAAVMFIVLNCGECGQCEQIIWMDCLLWSRWHCCLIRLCLLKIRSDVPLFDINFTFTTSYFQLFEKRTSGPKMHSSSTSFHQVFYPSHITWAV